MIRAPIFTVLCLSGSALFISTKTQTKNLKQAALKYLDLDKEQVLDQLGINEMLSGWPQILDDKCNRNELTDVHQINSPDFTEEIEQKDIFVYSNYLPPGYHQVIIYDPLTQKAFFKDFILSMNTKDFYREYPILQDPIKHTKIVQNVWRNWLVDTPKDNKMSFDEDINADTFDPSTFIK